MRLSLLLAAFFFAASARWSLADPNAAYEGLDAPSVPAPPYEPPPPWGGPDAPVLYSNGPLVWCNGPPACLCPGPPLGDESQIDETAVPPHTILGYGHQLIYGFRVADDFTVPPGVQWRVDVLGFFAYQTTALPGPSTITQVNLRVWDGPPDLPGSNIICGDVHTNRLFISTWSGIYRTSSLDTCATNRRVMWSLCLPPEDCPDCPGFPGTLLLGPGTYWLDWQSDGTLPLGPFAPPVTPDASAPDQSFNALQFTTAWGAPSEPCEFPFVIEGDFYGECPCNGDLNGDGRITLDDLVILQQCLVGQPIPVCDINCDGEVNQDDLEAWQCLFQGGGPECCEGQEAMAEETLDIAPLTLSLGGPNPFGTTTTLAFSLTVGGPVLLRVYDLQGRYVASLIDEPRAAGPHTFVWDGRDDSGSRVAAGVYYVRLEAGRARLTDRLVALR